MPGVDLGIWVAAIKIRIHKPESMKKYILDLTVSAIEAIHEKYVLIKLTQEAPLPPMLPGQFVEVRVDDSPSTFLRRPISINFVDESANELWLLVAAVGDGTRRLARLHVGDTVNCVLPLGNSFTLPTRADQKILLVGGGVGVAPLLYFGKKIREMGAEPTRVYVTTEDATAGEKGFVTNHSLLQNEHFDQISTCGPKPMMMAVARYAQQADIDCEVSLENKMACGLGACLCCVEKTTEGNVCVCTEGPVLNIKKLLWQV